MDLSVLAAGLSVALARGDVDVGISEVVIKEGAEVVIKEGAKVIKEGAKEGAKESAKESAKEGAKEGAKGWWIKTANKKT